MHPNLNASRLKVGCPRRIVGGSCRRRKNTCIAVKAIFLYLRTLFGEVRRQVRDPDGSFFVPKYGG